METQMTEGSNKGRILLTCSAILLAGVAGAGATLLARGTPKIISPIAQTSSFLEIRPVLPEKSAYLLLETKDTAWEIPVKARQYHLQADLKSPPAASYILKATLKPSQDAYRDLSVQVDSARSSISFLADGFAPGDTISMTINEKLAYSGVPFDWSGRIELESALPPELPARVCVRIQGGAQPLDLCHVVQKGMAA